MSWKALAGKFSGAVDPAMASARIGSAFGLAWAAAIGAAPRMISPSAPAAATDRMLAVATDWRTDGRPDPLPPALPQPAARVTGSAAGAGGLHQREVATHGQQGEGEHAVGVGTQAAEEPEVLDQHPVRQAQHR